MGHRWTPVAVGATLVTANVVNNRLLAERGDGVYVAWCMGSAGALVALARSDGCTWSDLGLARRDVGPGVRLGLKTAVTLGLAMAGFASTPAGQSALRDDRARRRGRRGAWRAALVRVPLGTVLLEEIAFRSVVPAVVARRTGSRGAVAVTVSAVVFGAWHILPSADLAADNQVVRRAVGGSRRASLALATLSTTAAGAGLSWLRARAGSVIAPALAHWIINGLGYVLAASRNLRQ